MAKRKSSDTQTELISFEESLNELQAIVKDLENGSIGLEASLTKFERGVGLLRMCYSTLEAAEQKVSILTKSLDRDEPVLAAFDPSSPAGIDGGDSISRSSSNPFKATEDEETTSTKPASENSSLF